MSKPPTDGAVKAAGDIILKTIPFLHDKTSKTAEAVDWFTNEMALLIDSHTAPTVASSQGSLKADRLDLDPKNLGSHSPCRLRKALRSAYAQLDEQDREIGKAINLLNIAVVMTDTPEAIDKYEFRAQAGTLLAKHKEQK